MTLKLLYMILSPAIAAASTASSFNKQLFCGQERKHGMQCGCRLDECTAVTCCTLLMVNRGVSAACCRQALMVAFYFSSSYVDVYIAKQQRRQLGLCDRCGGLNEPATCSQDGCPMKSKPQ
jgi:hypothetical protein